MSAKNTAARSRGELAAVAGRLIYASSSGSDSARLAGALGCTVAEIEAALLPAVLHHQLITCNLQRGAVHCTGYRASMSTQRAYDWRAQCEATWAQQQARLMAELAARGASISVPAPVPAPPAPAAQPALVLEQPKQPKQAKQPKPQKPQKPAPAVTPPNDVASELVAPAPRQPQAGMAGARVPYVGELDIDAIHRKLDKPDAEAALLRHLETAAPAALQHAIAETRDAADFIAALYSSGALLIESHGVRLQLPLQHTRKLLHYLDHLRADALVEHAFGELQS